MRAYTAVVVCQFHDGMVQVPIKMRAYTARPLVGRPTEFGVGAHKNEGIHSAKECPDLTVSGKRGHTQRRMRSQEIPLK